MSRTPIKATSYCRTCAHYDNELNRPLCPDCNPDPDANKCPLSMGHPFRHKDDGGSIKCANGDLCCSFCGSWDRAQYRAFVERILKGEVSATYEVKISDDKTMRLPRLEIADRRHKIYVKQERVGNAVEGAIKVYIAHLTQEDIDATNQALRLGYRGTQ